MTLEEIASRFAGARQTTRGGWEMLCPCHDDKRPSLGISVGEKGGVVMHCLAGCTNADILAAVGLTLRDLAPVATNGEHQPETVYRYDDEQGEPLFEVVKTADKRFWQRLPGGQKGKIEKRVLYRLPDLLRAPPHAPVFIVEGEKDADNLWKHHLPATTNPMGAGKWRQEFTDWLLARLPSRSFIILPDNDEPGLKHADEVLHSLKRAGLKAQVRQLAGLPPKGDVSDWLASGGDAAELTVAELPERRTARGFTAAELVGMVIKATKWAVPGYISEGLNILAGGQKLGKSWLAFDLALAVAMKGYAFGTIALEQGDALYLALEDTPRRLQERLIKLLQGEPAPERLHIFTEWPTLTEGGLDWLEAWLTEHPTARLVVIDTLKKIRPPRMRNGNAYDEDYDFMGLLKTMADRYEVAFLVLHHVRKMKAEDPFDAVSGTMGLTAAADATMVMQRVRGKTDAILHITGRDIEEREMALSWDRDTGMWSELGEADEYRRSQERQEIIRVLTESKSPMSPKEVADLLGKNNSTTRVLMMKMSNKGEIQLVSPGKYGPIRKHDATL